MVLAVLGGGGALESPRGSFRPTGTQLAFEAHSICSLGVFQHSVSALNPFCIQASGGCVCHAKPMTPVACQPVSQKLNSITTVRF